MVLREAAGSLWGYESVYCWLHLFAVEGVGGKTLLSTACLRNDVTPLSIKLSAILIYLQSYLIKLLMFEAK
jgi:hypothetical protein